jgi:hypothetical protein
MNEPELIRAQLAAERQHLAAVTDAIAALDAQPAPDVAEFRQACVDYLVCVLAWYEQRDGRLAQLLERKAPEDATRAALDEALGRHGGSRQALEKLEAALAGNRAAAWREFAQFFHRVWSARRDALEAGLGAEGRVGDWRALGGIDADTILEERARYARVRGLAPAHVALSAEVLSAR